ncbi:hypothetical protein SDC9_19950 [bioreactor metagenome]|uniref:Uncharacterized protein n=1 Tax=bioreactor metagenome TaxID=1076179 RepID=A0A644U5C4_9ZZZZ
MGRRDVLRNLGLDVQKARKRRRVLLGRHAFAHPHEHREARIAHPVALEFQIEAHRRQEPVDHVLRRAVTGETDAPGMADEIVIGEVALDLEDAHRRLVRGEILHHVEIGRIDADDQLVGTEIVEQHPHQRPAVAVALFHRALDAAQMRQAALFMEQVLDCGNASAQADLLDQPLRHMPLLAHHHHQRALAPEARFRFPKARREAAPDAAAAGQELVKRAPLVRDREADAGLRPQLAKPLLELGRVGADLAREQEVLRQQQVVMIVVEGHRHTVVGEHQEGEGPGADLLLRHDMAHDGLEEGLVGDPGGAEEAHHVRPLGTEGQHRLDRVPAQAPPLRADHHLDVLGHRPGQAKRLLQLEAAVEQPALRALVKPVAIDQPLFLDPGLDPVRGEEIEAFDVVDIGRIEEGMGEFGSLDLHAVAREHVEMRRLRKGRDRSLHRLERGCDKAPLAPAAFQPPRREGDRGVVGKRAADLLEIGRFGTGVEMDRDVIAGCRQPLRLRDDPVRVLVRQQDEGDFSHTRNSSFARYVLSALIPSKNIEKTEVL